MRAFPVLTHCTPSAGLSEQPGPGINDRLALVDRYDPLMMRISDHKSHQPRTGMPMNTMRSGMLIARYSNPIQKVLIWNGTISGAKRKTSARFELFRF